MKRSTASLAGTLLLATASMASGDIYQSKDAKEGVYIDDDGNTVRVEHRGHAGGR